jgi:hypothetical protein
MVNTINQGKKRSLPKVQRTDEKLPINHCKQINRLEDKAPDSCDYTVLLYRLVNQLHSFISSALLMSV